MNSETVRNHITDGGTEGIQTEGAAGAGFLGRGSNTGKNTYFHVNSYIFPNPGKFFKTNVHIMKKSLQSVLSGTSKSPQFPKKKEKMSLSEMQKQKISTDLSLVPSSSQAPGTSSSSTVPSSSPLIPQVESALKPEPQQQQQQPVKRAPGTQFN